MTARRTHIILALALTLLPARAHSDIIGLALQRRTEAYALAMDFFSANPAAMCLADSVSLSQACLSASSASLSGPVQMGTAERKAQLGASSYRRLGLQAAAWGSASFTAAKTRGVRYANCIDYLRVAPYVLGDSVGGALSSQRYEFAGGYARAMGRWTFGADMAYRAESAHRAVDPRVRDIVSDLTLGIGATMSVSASMRLGLAASLNVYSQDCDLEFYNPINDINTVAYTGLGTRYKRFEGNTNKSSGYKSIGYGLTAMLAPASLAGPRLLASFSGYRMPEQLRNFNNITLGFTSNRLASIGFAYRLDSPSVILEPSAGAACFERIGTENIFGSASGTGYQAIGSRSSYSLRIAMATVSCLAQASLGRHILSVKPSATIVRSREAYTSPAIAKKACVATPRVEARYIAAAGKWLLQADAHCSYAFGGEGLGGGARLAAYRAVGPCLPGLAACLGRSSISASFTITL